uniref:Uncharacterized protein n=1 Tax=Papilio xuthus TaxID=66420 RepID=I4DKX6_PAPXU|nr:unknown secreted protein [Papilio xuthus]
MERKNCFSVLLAMSILANAFCAPTPAFRLRRAEDDIEDSNDLQSISISTSSITSTEKTLPTPDPFDEDDDDDDFDDLTPAPSTGGSSVFSVLKLVTGLFPGSSSANSSVNSTDESPSPFWTLKLDIIRALLQFGTSVLGMASSTFVSASSG